MVAPETGERSESEFKEVQTFSWKMKALWRWISYDGLGSWCVCL
jgi:hypothetical protein